MDWVLQSRDEFLTKQSTILRELNDSDEWKERRLMPFKTRNLISETNNVKGEINDLDSISSFLPNEILQFEKNNDQKTRYEVCLMYIKLCGIIQYSQNCDRLSLYNPCEFLESLQELFEPIIKTISSQNGDIIKFLPSEIWAIWKCPLDQNIDTWRNLVHEVINCALHIQRLRDNYEMKDQTIIRVKIGISLGPFEMFKVDNDKVSHWIYLGRSLFEVQEAVHISLPGQILITVSERIKLLEYYYITEEYNKFIKILGVGPYWKDTANKAPPLIDGQFVVSSSSSEETIFNIPRDNESSGNITEKVGITQVNDLLKILPQPLSRCLQMGKSINHLSRIQTIVILHINIDMSSNVPEENLDFIEVLIRTLCSIIHGRNGFLYRTKIGLINVQTVFVFGNEDQKISMDCKEALNNALGSFIAFGKLKEVQNISVAVTSGISYGGVVNNTSRSTYVLICPSFKLASKLLKLYPRKVVCDKKTMLHSKINDDQFVLLEHQPMGNYEPGPIYEYIGNNRNLKNIISQDGEYPLLGNNEHMQLLHEKFRKYTSNFTKRRTGKYVPENEINAIVINGNHGQGKTKLLTEFSRKVKHAQIIHLDMKYEDAEVPFYAVRKIFEIVLHFGKKTAVKEKESKLKSMLENFDLSELLCSLNVVFDTFFEESKEFKIQSEDDKAIIVENILKRLAYECFDYPHIFAIDEGEYIDKFSWNILYELIDSKICFLIVTIKKKFHASIEAERLMKHKNCVHINLKNLDDICQTALICQILNVQAIPADLERIIHQSSAGNPGKIEKLIFDILDNNQLILKLVNGKELKDLNLVVPPFRLTKRSTNQYKFSISSQNLTDRSTEDKEEENIEHSIPNKIPVCLTVPNFSDKGFSVKITSEQKILSSFETLSSDQKFVLRAASILGDAFPRSMLIYVLNLRYREKNQMDIAEAIQGLFELGIFCCAKYQVSERRQLILKKNYVDISNKCDCLDSSTLEMYEIIPKYCFCQFLKFGCTDYKEVIRKFVPPDIAKESHTRALKYLSRESRKCNSCGNSFMSFEDFDSGKLPYSLIPQKYLMQSTEHNSEAGKTENLCMSPEKTFELHPSFSEFNYAQCECGIILSSVYKQMVEHFRGLEQYPEMLRSIVSYAELCLELKKYENALYHLRTGLKIIQTSSIALTMSNSEHVEGIVHTLMGKNLLGLLHKEEAYKSFCTALSILDVPFPTGNVGTLLKLYSLRLKRNTNFYNCLTFSKKKERDEETDVCRTIAKCLSGLFKIHKSNKNWKKAELCAIWSLTNSLKKGADVAQVFECLTNMMKIALHQKQHGLCKSLEHFGLELCRKEMKIQRRDLIGILKFYNISFLLRFHHFKLDKALHVGNLIVRISVDTNSIENILTSVPYIILGLIQQKKILEAYSLLRKVEYHSAETVLLKGKTWYYICNLILQLETGNSLVTSTEFETYCRDNTKDFNRHVTEKRKLLTLMWLWYVRNQEWHKSFDLFRGIFDYIIAGYLTAEKMGLYAMYVFEGVLLYIVQRSRERNILLECNLEPEVIQVCKKIASGNVAPIYIPRFTHLKAYHELCKNDEKTNGIYLIRALEASYEMTNLLEVGWIEHSKRVWFNNLPEFLKDAWKGNDGNGRQDMNPDKISYFTLPVPIH